MYLKDMDAKVVEANYMALVLNSAGLSIALKKTQSAASATYAVICQMFAERRPPLQR